MPDGYFARLIRSTPTRVWVNNPTLEEVGWALEQGAAGCTTNPSYGGGLLKRAPEEIRPVILSVVREVQDDELAVEETQRRLVARLLPRFKTRFGASEGRAGFVSLQGPPGQDHDPVLILDAARRARSLGRNCVPKIPATAVGIEAFAQLVAEGEPTVVTEVFSLDQVVAFAERYLDVTARTRSQPYFVIAPITGIFGDHLRALTKRGRLSVEAASIEWAGVAFARAAASLVAERHYPVTTLLFGGARTMVDLTGLVGDHHAATINWSTFEDVLRSDPECRATIREEAPRDSVASLHDTFADFRKAITLGSLRIEEFESFGPVQHFRNSFVAGWQAVLGEVAIQRAAFIGDTAAFLPAAGGY